MELVVIHGNGLSAISQRVSQIKKSFDPLAVVELNSQQLSWEEAIVQISSGSLFSDKRLVILEDFADADLEKLPQDPNLSLVLRFSERLSAQGSILKQSSQLKAQVMSFEEKDEKNIFPLLDYLSSKNPFIFKELDKSLADYGGQYILTMIFYSLRRFLTPKGKLPIFVARKIEQQRKNFPQERIKDLYKETILTDFKIKQGLLDEKIGLHLLAEKFLL